MKTMAISLAVVLIALAIGGAPVLADLPGGNWFSAGQYQNVGSDSAVVQLTTYAGGAQYLSKAKLAAPGAPVNFMNTEMGLPPGNFVGASLVKSQQPLVGVLYVTNYLSGGVDTASAMIRAVGMGNTASRLGFPMAKKKWGGSQKTTTFYIQNTQDWPTTIGATVSVLYPSGGVCTQNGRTFAIQPHEQINFTPADLACPEPMIGGLHVQALDGRLLAGAYVEADDDMNAPAGGTHALQGTTGFAIDGANPDYDDRLVAPMIKKSWGQ